MLNTCVILMKRVGEKLLCNPYRSNIMIVNSVDILPEAHFHDIMCFLHINVDVYAMHWWGRKILMSTHYYEKYCPSLLRHSPHSYILMSNLLPSLVNHFLHTKIHTSIPLLISSCIKYLFTCNHCNYNRVMFFFIFLWYFSFCIIGKFNSTVRRYRKESFSTSFVCPNNFLLCLIFVHWHNSLHICCIIVTSLINIIFTS